MKKIRMITPILLAVAVLCSGCGDKGDTIKIATKPMTEQFILGEMLSLIIEDSTDLKVEITKGIGGGTANIQPALLKGDFDLYPEYTGTGWLTVLKEPEMLEDTELYSELQKKYEEEYNLKWVGLYGFNNTFTLAVRKETAEKYNIKSYSDLAANSNQLIFGGNGDFAEREDGLIGLTEVYGFKFKETMDIDIALKYKALEEKKTDVANAYTTDGQLNMEDVALLEDDKGFFKNYYCGTVVRKDTLKKYPELEPALLKMENLLTDQDMAALNYKVEMDKQDERTVAKNFLIEKGVLNEQ